MKKTKVMNFVIAFILFASVTTASVFILSFVAFKSGLYDEAGVMSGIAVLAGSLCGSLYLKIRSDSESSVIIGCLIFLAFPVLLSLVTSKSEYSIPFLVPVCCSVGGALPFFISKKVLPQKVRRLTKKRSYR